MLYMKYSFEVLILAAGCPSRVVLRVCADILVILQALHRQELPRPRSRDATLEFARIHLSHQENS